MAKNILRTGKKVRPKTTLKGKRFRCAMCRKLVTAQVLATLGTCTCGSTRVTEVRTLTPEEHADIQAGKIKFADSDLFLKEFAAVDTEQGRDPGDEDRRG